MGGISLPESCSRHGSYIGYVRKRVLIVSRWSHVGSINIERCRLWDLKHDICGTWNTHRWDGRQHTRTEIMFGPQAVALARIGEWSQYDAIVWCTKTWSGASAVRVGGRIERSRGLVVSDCSYWWHTTIQRGAWKLVWEDRFNNRKIVGNLF